jgi:hypothetical protein
MLFNFGVLQPGARADLLEEFDLRVVAEGRTHPAVAGDQRSVKEFGQSYVGSIVGGEIAA